MTTSWTPKYLCIRETGRKRYGWAFCCSSTIIGFHCILMALYLAWLSWVDVCPRIDEVLNWHPLLYPGTWSIFQCKYQRQNEWNWRGETRSYHDSGLQEVPFSLDTSLVMNYQPKLNIDTSTYKKTTLQAIQSRMPVSKEMKTTSRVPLGLKDLGSQKDNISWFTLIPPSAEIMHATNYQRKSYPNPSQNQ